MNLRKNIILGGEETSNLITENETEISTVITTENHWENYRENN